MTKSKEDLWEGFRQCCAEFPAIGLAICLGRVNSPDDYLASMEPHIQIAFLAMAKLEKGGIVNHDEERMVGHFWLRNPDLAPTQAIHKRATLWDWVGGRTRRSTAVGLSSSRLQGFDFDEIISSATKHDEITRQSKVDLNPAAEVALKSFGVVNDTGGKSRAILPFKYRVELFHKYFPRACMKSLDKELDLDGGPVDQANQVLVNRDKTSQHVYIEHVNNDITNYSGTLIDVLNDRQFIGSMVDENETSVDYWQFVR